MTTTQTAAVKNCIVLIVLNNTGKFFMKIEHSDKYKGDVIKFLTHKKECNKAFVEKDETELLKETIKMYFDNQINTDSFEKVDVMSKEDNVFHVYTATLKKHVDIIGSKINLIDPKKISGQTNSIEISHTPCLITDFTKEISKKINK